MDKRTWVIGEYGGLSISGIGEYRILGIMGDLGICGIRENVVLGIMFDCGERGNWEYMG